MSHISASAQPRVTVIQDLTFGTFSPIGSSGTITISNTGVVTSTGVVLFPSPSANEAIFDFDPRTSNRNVTSITITKNPVYLTRAGGTQTMRLTLNTPNPSSFSVKKNVHKTVTIGGTLTIGSSIANPGGSYSGSFELNFFYQ